MGQHFLEALGYALGAVTLLILKYIFDIIIKKVRKDTLSLNFRKSISITAKINEELSTIRDVYGFNRVSLIDYHNGTESFKGLSFKNASMRNEVVDNKTKNIITDFQNIPCSIIAEMLVELEDSKEGYIIATDEGDSATAITHKMYGVRIEYNFKIGKDLTEGVVSMVFTDTINRLTKEQIIEIKAHIQKIRLLRTNKVNF